MKKNLKFYQNKRIVVIFAVFIVLIFFSFFHLNKQIFISCVLNPSKFYDSKETIFSWNKNDIYEYFDRNLTNNDLKIMRIYNIEEKTKNLIKGKLSKKFQNNIIDSYSTIYIDRIEATVNVGGILSIDNRNPDNVQCKKISKKSLIPKAKF